MFNQLRSRCAQKSVNVLRVKCVLSLSHCKQNWNMCECLLKFLQIKFHQNKTTAAVFKLLSADRWTARDCEANRRVTLTFRGKWPKDERQIFSKYYLFLNSTFTKGPHGTNRRVVGFSTLEHGQR